MGGFVRIFDSMFRLCVCGVSVDDENIFQGAQHEQSRIFGRAYRLIN